MNKVFIHQDLTPRQRAKRQLLIAEKKQREASGENYLIIINDNREKNANLSSSRKATIEGDQLQVVNNERQYKKKV